VLPIDASESDRPGAGGTPSNLREWLKGLPRGSRASVFKLFGNPHLKVGPLRGRCQSLTAKQVPAHDEQQSSFGGVAQELATSGYDHPALPLEVRSTDRGGLVKYDAGRPGHPGLDRDLLSARGAVESLYVPDYDYLKCRDGVEHGATGRDRARPKVSAIGRHLTRSHTGYAGAGSPRLCFPELPLPGP
jgi:hypothetical protein